MYEYAYSFSNPMILFLQHSAGGKRGGEQYTLRLHSFLKAKFGPIEPEELRPRPQELENIVSNARESLKLVKAKLPSLIVTDISSGARNILAARWAKRHGSTLLLVVQARRTSYRYKSALSRWLMHRLENHLIGLADIVVVNSRYIAGYVAEHSSRETKIVICHPGLEINNEAVGQDNAPLPKLDAPLNLLSVGDCAEPVKGIKYLLEALPSLSDLNLRLHLAGEYSPGAPHYKILNDIIERHNLGELVSFRGFLDHQRLSELYRQTDIFVMPSLSEGYGMALAEALSFGLPVVASNVAAIPEMIEDGVNGLLVPPKDPQTLAEAIRRLVASPSLRDRMSRVNLAKAKTLPTWSDFDSTLERELAPLIEKLTGPKAK